MYVEKSQSSEKSYSMQFIQKVRTCLKAGFSEYARYLKKIYSLPLAYKGITAVVQLSVFKTSLVAHHWLTKTNAIFQNTPPAQKTTSTLVQK